jgi:protein-S-isoprenylcysteine O-methyltransferase Ste14
MLKILKKFLFETWMISLGVVSLLLFKYVNFSKESNIPGFLGVLGVLFLCVAVLGRAMFWYFFNKSVNKKRKRETKEEVYDPTIVAFQQS